MTCLPGTAPRRWHIGSLRSVVGLLLFTTLAGCRHATLGTPAFVGASATAGFGASTVAQPDGELPVDLAVAYDAVVRAGHGQPERFGDALFYLRPADAAREQAAALAGQRPSIIFAVDWLFWAAYAPLGTEDEEAGGRVLTQGPGGGTSGASDLNGALDARLRRVDAALAELEAANVARSKPALVVLGDLPDFGGVSPASNRPVSAVESAEIDALNQHVASWAAARPWVVLLPVSELAGESQTLPDGTPLMQSDGLHPTAAGLVLLMQTAMVELERRGAVRPGDWNRDPAKAMAALPQAARKASDTPSAGWLDKASMYLAYRALADQLEAKPVDCDAVVRNVGRLFANAHALDEDPSGTGWGALVAVMAAEAAIGQCPEAAVPVRRCADRLALDIRRPRPNPFRFDLWCDLSKLLGREAEVEERVAILCRELGPDWGPYRSSIDGVLWRQREVFKSDPRIVAEARARAVEIVGGVGPSLDRGVWLLEEHTAEHGSVVGENGSSEGRPSEQPTPSALPVVTPRGDSAESMPRHHRQLAATRVLEFYLDLRGAALLGVDGADAASQELLHRMRADLGDDAVGWAVELSRSICACPLLPNGGVARRGYVDPATRLQWAQFSGDDALSISIPGLIQSSGAASGTAPMSAAAPMTGQPEVAIGLLGPFGAPDGALTIVDGRALVTRLEMDSPTTESVPVPVRLVSRDAEAADAISNSVRSQNERWTTRSVGSVDDLPQLWSTVWSEAQRAGVNVLFPFMVRADGAFESITVRVERGPVDPPTQGVATNSLELLFGARLPRAREPVTFEVSGVDATLVGIVAPWSVSRMVRPGEPMRFHAVWRDGEGARHTAEVVGLRGGRGVELRVPEAGGGVVGQ